MSHRLPYFEARSFVGHDEKGAVRSYPTGILVAVLISVFAVAGIAGAFNFNWSVHDGDQEVPVRDTMRRGRRSSV